MVDPINQPSQQTADFVARATEALSEQVSQAETRLAAVRQLSASRGTPAENFGVTSVETPVSTVTPQDPPIPAPSDMQFMAEAETLEPSEPMPYVVAAAQSDNPSTVAAVSLLYGTETTERAVAAYNEGYFERDDAEGYYQMTPQAQYIESASGVDKHTIGLFLLAQQVPELKNSFIESFGYDTFLQISGAARSYSDQKEEEAKKGFFGFAGSVVGDMGTFFQRDVGDTTASIGLRTRNNVTLLASPGEWGYGLNKQLAAIPAFRGMLTDVRVAVPTDTQEQLNEIKALFPGKLELIQSQVGRPSAVTLNPEELELYNQRYGYEGHEAVRALQLRQRELIDENIDSTTGEIAAVIGEWGVAFAATPGFTGGFGKLLTSANGFLKGAVKTGDVFLDGAVKGAVADNAVYQEGDPTLIELANELGVPGMSLFEWMETDDDASELLNRARVSGEGMLVGGVFNMSLTAMAKVLVGLRNAARGNADEAMENFKDAAEAQATENAEVAVKEAEEVDAIVNEVPEGTPAPKAEGDEPEAPKAEGEETEAPKPEGDEVSATNEDLKGVAQVFDNVPLLDLRKANLNRADIDNLKILDRMYKGYVGRGSPLDADSFNMRDIFGDDWIGSVEDFSKMSLEQIEASKSILSDQDILKMATRFKRTMEKLQNPRTLKGLQAAARRSLDKIEKIYGPETVETLRKTPVRDWTTDQLVNTLLAPAVMRQNSIDIYKLQKEVAKLQGQGVDPKRIKILQKKITDLMQNQFAIQFENAQLGRTFSLGMNAQKINKSYNNDLNAMQRNLDWEVANGVKTQEQADKAMQDYRIKRQPKSLNKPIIFDDVTPAARELEFIINGKKMSEQEKADFLEATVVSGDVDDLAVALRESASLREGFFRKLLSVSNANVLFQTGTQFLMLGSSLARSLLKRPILDVVDSLVVTPLDSLGLVFKGKPKAALQNIADNLPAGLMRSYLHFRYMGAAYGAGFKAFNRFWKTSISDFTRGTAFDEDPSFLGKSLEDVRKEAVHTKGLEAGLDHANKYAEYLYRWMGSADEMFKEIVYQTEMAVASRMGDYADGLQQIARKRMPTDEEYLTALAGRGDLVRGYQGRALQEDAIKTAANTTFQGELVEGSLAGTIYKFVSGASESNAIIRMLLIRFAKTPLNVMEERLLTTLSPLVTVADMIGGQGGKAFNRFLVGKFAADLQSKNPLVQRRTRAVIAQSNLAFGLGMVFAGGMFSGKENRHINTDPKSPHFLALKLGDRYYDIRDVELPFYNSFVMGAVASDLVTRGKDPKQALELTDTFAAIAAMFMNESLEKSSVGNMTEFINVFTSDNFDGWESAAVGTLSPFVPFNSLTVRLTEFFNEGAFPGKPRSFSEAIGKQIPAFRMLVQRTLNYERDAMGNLLPSTNRGLMPFASRVFDTSEAQDELANVEVMNSVEFSRDTFKRIGVKLDVVQGDDGMSIFDNMLGAIADGSVRVDGYTMAEAADRMLNDEAYHTRYTTWAGIIESKGLVDTTGDGRPNRKAINVSLDQKDPRIEDWRGLLVPFYDRAFTYVYENSSEETKARIAAVRDGGMFTEQDLVRALND